MSDARWEQINQALGFERGAARNLQQANSNNEQQNHQIRTLHTQAKRWLYAELAFTLSVIIVTIQMGFSNPVGHKHGHTQLYLVFLLQILILNIVPHLLAKLYFYRKMLSWPFRKVKNFDHGLFLSHSVLVMFSTMIGFTAEHSGQLLGAIGSSMFPQIVMILTYCYLVYWSMVGLCTFVILLIWGFLWLYRCPSRRQQRIDANQRLLRQAQQRGDVVAAPMDSLTMNESDYNPYLFSSYKECIICMEEFVPAQKVTALPCDERHYFHSECILSWSERHRNCPLCKKPYNVAEIKKFNKKFVKLAKKANRERRLSVSSSLTNITLETIPDEECSCISQDPREALLSPAADSEGEGNYDSFQGQTGIND